MVTGDKNESNVIKIGMFFLTFASEYINIEQKRNNLFYH